MPAAPGQHVSLGLPSSSHRFRLINQGKTPTFGVIEASSAISGFGFFPCRVVATWGVGQTKLVATGAALWERLEKRRSGGVVGVGRFCLSIHTWAWTKVRPLTKRGPGGRLDPQGVVRKMKKLHRKHRENGPCFCCLDEALSDVDTPLTNLIVVI
jgi:hypothetical protein